MTRNLQKIFTEEALRLGLPGIVTYHQSTGSWRLHWRDTTDHWSHLGHTEGEARREIERQARDGGFAPRITKQMVADAEYDLWQVDRHGVDIDPESARQIIALGVGAVPPTADKTDAQQTPKDASRTTP